MAHFFVYNFNMDQYSSRTVLHCDLNNFYASVECLVNPDLKNKPVVVTGDVKARHGVVLAKNQIAKNAGIKTGMVLWEASQKIQGLVAINANFPLYIDYSRKVREIYARYTDYIESFGIDECWLDVTHSQKLFGNGETIANKIREQVKNEIGLTISVGVSFNKVFAKLGSDLKKPDAVSVISRENFKQLIWPLPTSELLYVGKKTCEKLARIGINTIGDLACSKEQTLNKLLGKWGTYLQIFALGFDATPVAKLGKQDLIKSVGNSTTTPRDLNSTKEVNIIFDLLADSVASRLRAHKLKASVVSIWVRDNELKTFSYQGRLLNASCLSHEIAKKAKELFLKHKLELPIRSLGINTSSLTFIEDNEHEQLNFFTNNKARNKSEKLEFAIDNIRKKYGHNSILNSNLLLDEELTFFNPKNEEESFDENSLNKTLIEKVNESHKIHPYSFF